nr:hypothetical protein [Bacilli bacterium]
MAGKSFFMHKNSAGLCTNSLHKSALLFCNKQKKKFKQDPTKTSNWTYDEKTDSYICPSEKQLTYQYDASRKDR